MYKKMMSLLLALTMVLSLLPMNVLATEEGVEIILTEPPISVSESDDAPATYSLTSGTCGENLTWTLSDDGVLTISGTGPMENYNSLEGPEAPWDDQRRRIVSVVIEEGVTTVGDCAFFACAITTASLPSTLTSIGWWSFHGCKKLTDLTIPSGVTTIRTQAFGFCESLTALTIPESVTRIDSSAFSYCPALESIVLPQQMTQMGGGVFSGCSALKEIVIPDGITAVGESLFKGCSSLTKVTLPDTITEIGVDAFYGCSALKEVSIEEGVVTIGNNAFRECVSLEKITIPGTVSLIDEYTFYGCSALKEVTIEEGVLTIGNSAFRDCVSLEKIMIPLSLTMVDDYAFCDCDNLSKVDYGGKAEDWAKITVVGWWNDALLNANIEYNVCPVNGAHEKRTFMEGYRKFGCGEIYDSVVKCVPCGKEFTRETVIVRYTPGSAPHYEAAAVEENRVEPTCGETGSYDSVTYCIICKKEASRTEVEIPATGDHTEAAAVEENREEPTCSEDGSHENVVYCSVCSAELSRTPQTIPATGNHRKAAAVKENYKENSCETAGSYDSVVYCVDCSTELSRTKETIPPIGHHTEAAPVEENRKASTCIAEGSYESVVYCSVCEKELRRTKETLPISKYHREAPSVIENRVEPSGLENGYCDVAVYCSDCGRLLSRRTETLSVKTVQESEKNDYRSYANEVELNSMVSGGLSHLDFNDYFKFTITKKGPVQIRIIGKNVAVLSTSSIRYSAMGITLYDGSGKKICDATVLGSQDGVARFVFNVELDPGTYYLHIWDNPDITLGVAQLEKMDYEFVIMDNVHTHTGGKATCKELAKCTVCGKYYGQKEPSNHAGGTEVRDIKEATDTTEGYTGDTYCLGCETIIAKGGTHRHSGGKATCKSPAICTDCGQAYGAKDPSAHVGGTELRNRKDATATEEGYTGDTYCKGCGEMISQGRTIPVNVEVTITRVAGAGRCETAIEAANKIKAKKGIDKFDSIILANGDNFADALAGSYLATYKDAPILLYRGNAMTMNLNYIRSNLASGGTVYLLGGTAAVPVDAENTLRAAGINVQRLAGNDRFKTNLEILKASNFNGGRILVCTGHEFADSLSASAAGLPILLVHKQWTALTDEYKAYLNGKSCEFIIVGGNAAVKSELEGALRQYGSVERLAGSDRYGTSVLVANRFFGDVNTVALAYGRNFPDGLCGGPLAYAYGGPLLLTEAGKESIANGYVKSKPVFEGYVLGGTGVLSDATVNKVFAK